MFHESEVHFSFWLFSFVQGKNICMHILVNDIIVSNQLKLTFYVNYVFIIVVFDISKVDK